MLPDVNIDLAPGEVELTGTVLGKGAYGRVVVGAYGGQRVAVKLMNTGLVLPGRGGQAACAGEAPPCRVAKAAPSSGEASPGPSAASRRPPGDWELVPVTPLTPMLPDVNIDLAPGEVELTGTVLGKGAYGRVVVGAYGGQRVAVKLMNTGLVLPGRGGQACSSQPAVVTTTEPAAPGSASAPERGAEASLDVSGADRRGPTDDGPAGQGAGPRGGAALLVRAVLADRPDGRQEGDGHDGGPDTAAHAQLKVRACYDEGGDGGQDEGDDSAIGEEEREQRLFVARMAEYGRAFGREVAVLARCRHPNIVRLLAASLQ
ncbi:hypothetical protein GPECTOR_246g602 [Gonium pectorale]|uniref:Protein kinase domain-containing protein n=1 Tax=Gonium pectorale TaxID=33097 RepID=A0A150FWD2_GONPE|nr:hypothetical protein GPECTOR_246g602 [Gonium pectorale]|eukprot:KXZ41909.1 hypothetical protein GPECTOR_246g602 [Gonium pectorale]